MPRVIAAFLLAMALGCAPAPAEEVHALWLHPGDLGHSRESVRQFVERARRAHIELLVALVRGMDGSLHWNSKKFPQAIHPAYRDFDMLGTLVEEAHRSGLKAHAWLCDFVEGENSAVVREHPEWVQLNEDGKMTNSETLGPGRPYPYVWMCPARRPGYTDQWLLPQIEEIVRSYPVDGIHHDYVRYPGDVSPDGYCFCDYCVNDIFRHHLLAYESEDPRRFTPQRNLPRLAADLGREYVLKPSQWDEWTRREKANFLLHGRYSKDAPADMNYYFYTYRSDAITRFVREVQEAGRRLRPNLEFSAAVFKNPMSSARFIGQRWSEFAPWVDFMMPMSYRSHFTGDFAAYLRQFGEYTRRQKEWAGRSRFYQGIATTYLYKEEMDELGEVARLARAGGDPAPLEKALAPVLRRLRPLDAARAAPLEALKGEELAKEVEKLRGDPPEGYYPPEKLLESIRVARENGAEGIVIFAAGSVSSQKLWPTLEKAFGKR